MIYAKVICGTGLYDFPNVYSGM